MIAVAGQMPHVQLNLKEHSWYEFLPLPLAFLIAYPDKIARWIFPAPQSRMFPNVGKIYWVVFTELVAIGLLVVVAHLLSMAFSDWVWWNPIGWVSFCIALRLILSNIL